MKKVKYLAMLLAAGMFAACSDNLEDTGAGNAGGTTPGTMEGYVRVAINMPTTSGNSSRADDQPDSETDTEHDVELTDGIADEYAIKNGFIAFFKAPLEEGKLPTNPETDAKYVQAYALSSLETIEGEAPQVTERVVTVTEAPQVTDKEQLYALVVLNYDPTIIQITSGSSLSIKRSSTGEADPITTSDNLNNFQDKITASISSFTSRTDNNQTYVDRFTMTNAPLSTTQGSTASTMSGATAKILVPVTVYETEEEASRNEATKIYVERVAAKVTLSGFSKTEHEINVTKNDVLTGDVVKLNGWLLNVTNLSTRLVRQVTGYTNSGWLNTSPTDNQIQRFAGTLPISANFEGEEKSYYRIYWGEDCNYDSATPASDFMTYYTDQQSGNTDPITMPWNKNTADDATTTSDYACYCLENTMNYSEQMQDRTTSVLMQTSYLVKFGDEEEVTPQDFFICGTDPTKHPGKDKTTTEPTGTILSFVNYVQAQANDQLESENEIASLTLIENLQGGLYDNETEIMSMFKEGNSLTEIQKAAILRVVGNTVSYYKGGVSYYHVALIRHFQDGEGVALENPLEDYTLQHLGRYGVLRNNWYDIHISSISGPGDPEIIKPGGKDDQQKGYIRAEINVLSWAKRTQDVDL